jgi:hypothetical protein
MTTSAHDNLGDWLVDLFSRSSAAMPRSGEARCSQAIAIHPLQRKDGSAN